MIFPNQSPKCIRTIELVPKLKVEYIADEQHIYNILPNKLYTLHQRS